MEINVLVLIIGSGGREHALAWKCAQVANVVVAPGNAGTALEQNISNVNAENIKDILTLATAADLTIIGPEVPLVAGMVDEFNKRGLPCFGPTAKAAQLEGSKIFAKEFLQRHNIPTARYKKFTEMEPALRYVIDQEVPIVVKADGLFAGKGVVVAQTLLEAKDAVVHFIQEGHHVIVEEFIEGEEVSFMVITDGETILPLASSKDYKARDDGDKGPNTGGMGAYSPASITKELEDIILKEVIQPTISGLKAEGINYLGFLYAGLMITDNGIKVLEFNCRLGDPETQPIMARLKSNLVELCLATIQGDLRNQTIEWDERVALGVVMAADGYPRDYKKGHIIKGLEDVDAKVFHAGTIIKDDKIVTNGGRVLCVVGLGDTITEARDVAYTQTKRISWDGHFFRNDIGL